MLTQYNQYSQSYYSQLFTLQHSVRQTRCNGFIPFFEIATWGVKHSLPHSILLLWRHTWNCLYMPSCTNAEKQCSTFTHQPYDWYTWQQSTLRGFICFPVTSSQSWCLCVVPLWFAIIYVLYIHETLWMMIFLVFLLEGTTITSYITLHSYTFHQMITPPSNCGWSGCTHTYSIPLNILLNTWNAYMFIV